MRIVFIAAWGTLLLLFTCTASLQELLHHGAVRFEWIADPDFRDLWIVRDARVGDADWLRIKCGHLTGFGIFGMLCWMVYRSFAPSVLIASLFACATEVLQLYCMRDGRLLDMGIDAGGIVICCSLLSALRRSGLLSPGRSFTSSRDDL